MPFAQSEQSRIGGLLSAASLVLLGATVFVALLARSGDLQVVYFVYGLAFVLLGIVTLTPQRFGNGFALGENIWLLSCFGLLHGLVEWVDYWQVAYGRNPLFDMPRALVLLLSYLALFEFGRRLLRVALQKEGILRAAARLSFKLTIGLLATLLISAFMLVGQSDASFPEALNAMARYLLCLPGSWMAAIALLLVGSRHLPEGIAPRDRWTLHAASITAGIGFAAYGVFGGLIIIVGSMPLPVILSQADFLDMTGIPVQVFRAFSAVPILLGMAYLMRVFKLLNQMQLRAHETRYRQIIETTTDGFWLADKEGWLLEVNQAYIDRSGYSHAELLAMHISDLEAQQNPSEVARNIALLMARGHGLFESRHRSKSGEIWPVEVNVSFLPDGGGNFCVFIRDIASRKQAEAALQEKSAELDAYFNSALDLFCIADTDGYFRKVNNTWFDVLGYTSEELEGQRFLDLVHPDDLPATLEAVSRLSGQNTVLNFINRYRCKDGSWRWIEWRSKPSGKLIYAAARDITQRKEAEQTMRLAQELAEESARVKSEFLANMSHEIRTPMNAILGLTQIVLDGELTAEQRDHLAKVRHASRLLLNILNDILDLSKIEAGRLHIESAPFGLRKTAQDALDLYGANARDKGLALHLDVAAGVPDAVIGDPYRFSQVLGNLLSNAVKFTESGEVRVILECIGCEAESCELRVSVRDTGIGVSTEQINRLFRPFTQADASNTRKFGGTGLGLVICKQLVELMGGQITVSSAVGQGSTFAFTMRLGMQHAVPESAQAVPAASLSVESLRGKRILLAEDNYLNQVVARTFLGKLGMEVPSPTMAAKRWN